MQAAPYRQGVRLWFAPLVVILFVTACTGLGGEPQIVATLPVRTAPPSAPTQSPQAVFPTAAPDLAVGAQTFVNRCARCHGSGGAGDGELVLTGQIVNPGNFTDPTSARAQTPQDWFNTITNGRVEKLMPPWRDALSAADRWNVALYTYTLHYTPQQLARGEEVWNAACGESCDSLDGIGSLSDQAVLATVSDGALRAALPDSISSEEDAWAAVAYLRARTLQNTGVIGQPPPAPAATEEAGPQVSAPQATAPAVAESVTGAIIGQVTNGTAGSDDPVNMEVTLFRWDSQFAPLEPLTTTTDAEGRYRFDNIELNPAYAYGASVSYRDNRFLSRFARGTTNPLELPITVYEATEDPSVIKITGLVTQLTAIGTGVQVVQIFNFDNTSDRYYTTSETVGEDAKVSLVINLPPGAAIIGFPNNENRFVVSEDQTTVVDTLPVMPDGDHIVQLVYLLPYNDEAAIIEQPLNYPLDGEVRLLLLPDTLEAVTDQLTLLGPQTVGSNTYRGYGGTLQLTPNDVLRFELRGSAAPAAAQLQPTQSISSNNLIGIALVAVGVVVLVGAGLVLYNRSRSAPAPQPPAKTPPKPKAQAQPAASDEDKLIDALVRQIAELDDDHTQGRINHDVYQRQRRKLKKRLSELMGEDDGG
jgi:mono/diheme cytochrome c family protein